MRLELLRGTLDLLVLKALAGEPRHGYEIARWLELVTDDALTIEEGSLYPALHRMARRGWIEPTWGISENNRRARYYALTPDGRAQLGEQANAWDLFTRAVAQVMAAPVSSVPSGAMRES